MNLNKLIIRNFKGISDFALDLGGHDAAILGDNGLGKTTIYDSFLWCLFGKDSSGASDFMIEPAGSRGQNIETSVTVVLDTDNGPYTLERRRSENWVKERGSSEAVFKGYTTAYFCDQLPMKEAAFKDLIAGLCPEHLFKFLTNPRAFPAMKPKEQRDMLFSIAGALTDQQIIDADPALAPLNERGRHSVEDYKKVQQAQRKTLAEELNRLPARINEAGLAIKADTDIPAAQANIAAIRERQHSVEAAMRPTTTDELTAKIGRLHLQLDALVAENREHIAAQDAAARKTKQDIVDGLRADLRATEDALEADRRQLNALREEDERLERRIGELRADYKATTALQWTGDSCPACNRQLPEEDVAPKRAAFNQQRAEKLSTINDQGQAAAARRIQIQLEADPINGEIAVLAAKKAGLHKKLQDAEAMTWTATPMPDYEDRRHAIAEELAPLEADDASRKAAEQEAVAGLRKQAQELRDQIAGLETAIAQSHANEDQRQRVAQLKEQQKTVAKQLEACDRIIALCEDFTRAKVAAVEESINGKFQLARWKLFEQQINGGLADCCVVTVGGVEYHDLNHAMQINVGLDIINTLSKHHDITAPIFIDNSESVVRLEPTEAQTIRLVVSEAHKELTVEVA